MSLKLNFCRDFLQKVLFFILDFLSGNILCRFFPLIFFLLLPQARSRPGTSRWRAPCWPPSWTTSWAATPSSTGRSRATSPRSSWRSSPEESATRWGPSRIGPIQDQILDVEMLEKVECHWNMRGSHCAGISQLPAKELPYLLHVFNSLSIVNISQKKKL